MTPLDCLAIVAADVFPCSTDETGVVTLLLQALLLRISSCSLRRFFKVARCESYDITLLVSFFWPRFEFNATSGGQARAICLQLLV